MQRDLNALMDWGSTWGMKFNAKKCNIMRVSRSRKPLQHFNSLGNEILQEVSDAKYLGIQIDNKLDWNKHISTVAARGQSKLAFLNRNLKGCPKKLRDTAYFLLLLLLVVQPSVYSAWSAIAALHFLFIAFSLDLEVRLLHSFGTIGESSIEHK